MGKYSVKNLKMNPKKKKPNKKHKQKYFKKENKPIDKSKYYEVKGKRTELEPYVNEEFVINCFLTNSYKYSGEKRLLNSVVFPIYKDGKNLYITHAWVRTEKTKNVPHGFRKIKIKIIKYKDYYKGGFKYGVRVIEVLK